MVVGEKLTKRAHFKPSRNNDRATEVAQRFSNEIVRLHGLPGTIVSDRDTKFTSLFWKSLFERLGTRLAMSTTYHPQTDGQSEQWNQEIEAYLHMFYSRHCDNWVKWLPIAEFVTIQWPFRDVPAE